MEDLDKTLDMMERDKCTTLLAENAVRLKKNNIKFTTTDKKHSQAHLDAQELSALKEDDPVAVVVDKRNEEAPQRD